MVRAILTSIVTLFVTFGGMYILLERPNVGPVINSVPGLKIVLDFLDTSTVAVEEEHMPGINPESIFGLFTQNFVFTARSQNAPVTAQTPAPTSSWWPLQPYYYEPEPTYQPNPVQPTQPVQPVRPAQSVQPLAQSFTENYRPDLENIGNQTVPVGGTLSFVIRATDRNNDVLYYRALSLPPGSSFNAANRRFTWTPTTAGTYTAKFEAYDGKEADTEIATIVVQSGQAVVQPPVTPTTTPVTPVPETPTTPTPDPNVINIRTYGAKLDGTTDDSTAIQAAFDAATSGQTILIDGIAAVGAKGVSLHDKVGVTLRGKKAGDGIKPLAAPTENRPVTALYKGVLQVQNCNSCIVENITMHGNNIDGVMIAVSGSQNTKIKNNTITDVGLALAAFSAGGNTGNEYVGNSIARTKSQGANSTRGMWIGNVWPTEFERNALISDNTLADISSSGLGVTVEGGRIIGNTVRNVNGSGIVIAGSAPPNNSSSNLLIENNTVTNAGLDGIQADSYVRPGSRSAGSVDGPDAWLLPNITIKNNSLYANKGTGIYVVWARNWNITGNTIRDNGLVQSFRPHGVIVSGNRSVTIADNSFYNSGTSRTQQIGIYVTSSGETHVHDVIISNNQIYNHLKTGIVLNNCCGGIHDGVTISSNTIRDNSEYGMTIYPEKASDSAISRLVFGDIFYYVTGDE